jgi:hypothetical protein
MHVGSVDAIPIMVLAHESKNEVLCEHSCTAGIFKSVIGH